jgi:hypothetical protein
MMDPYPCAAEAPLAAWDPTAAGSAESAAGGHGRPPTVIRRESGDADQGEEISGGSGMRAR